MNDIDQDEAPAPRFKRHPRIAEIQEAVCATFQVRMGDLLSDRRDREAAWARQAAMYLSKELTPLSLPAIGRMFNRDHTTVLYATREVPRRISGNDTFASRVIVARSLASARAAERMERL